ncbi:adenosine deaminase [Streptomyces sp. NPDC017993]|uniref:adenosine deaminase n=1 Tax=Streptomyces sp. NPDC017993 TaxID=3365027 RepID=UPI003787DE72
MVGVGVFLVASAVALPLATADAVKPEPDSERSTIAREGRVAAHLEHIRDAPHQLREFMRAMPKGADLHNHLSGAASTQLLIDLAVQSGLCIEEDTSTAVPGPCKDGSRPASDVRTDSAFGEKLARAWSMKDFPRNKPSRAGHDHFFATFDKFMAVTTNDFNGKLQADVANTAARNHQKYLETMISPAFPQAAKLAKQVGYDKDLAALHERLTSGGKLDRLVNAARKEADNTDRDFRRAAQCGTAFAQPGCKVETRFLSHALRALAPADVFTQLELGMALAEKDRRFVGVNLVQPEDDKNALRNYRLHMRMLDFLHSKYPNAHIALHAGELTPEFVGRKDLTFHINEAVRVGHAERIGHGVDLKHEDLPRKLLHTMAKRGVALEANLTSNEQILQVSGKDHPFQTYRKAGVPVTISTDDPGISRTDISREYERAATTYGLSYPELKGIARTSLEEAFLPGKSLWNGKTPKRTYRPVARCAGQEPGASHPGARCQALLDSSPKAQQEWELEAAFRNFERRVLKHSL